MAVPVARDRRRDTARRAGEDPFSRRPTLWLSLPNAAAEGEIIDPQMAAVLLLVDDDEIFRALAVDILRDLGVEEIVQAGTAAAAVDTAHNVRPAAALVDVGLPDRDGIDLAYELAALPWGPAVVLISADRDAAARIESRGDGAPPFVPKDELPNAPLRRLLQLD